jgi:O-antigen/teichoic acid export membrane protein
MDALELTLNSATANICQSSNNKERMTLDKKAIRLQYSGFVIFTAQILSVITGLAYTLLLTRSMSQAQYGTWTNIFDYTNWFLIFTTFIPFWATRFVARCKDGTVKTSTVATLIISLGSIAVYLPVITLVAQSIGTVALLPVYYIAGIYILDSALVTNLEACLRSYKPQTIGYGLLIAEIIKVAIAFGVIVGLGQLFLGAILSLSISALVQVFYYIKVFSGEFKQKIHWGYLREWVKGSALIAYSAVGAQVLGLIFILLYNYGGADTRAYYQAAFTFTNIINYASSLAFALYPKILNNSYANEQVKTSFKTVMMFGIPMAALVMVMSTSFLTVLKAEYAVAWPVLIILTIDTLIVMISGFYSNLLMGVESFDADGKIPLRQIPKTKLFKVFSLSFIQAAISLPIIYFVLTEIPAGPVESVVYVIAINIGVHISTFIGLYLTMHKQAHLPVDWKSIGKFVFAAVVMALILYFTPFPTTLLLTLVKTGIGLAIYIGLLLAIDHQARKLLGLIIEEIKGTYKQFILKRNNNNNNNHTPSENACIETKN